MEFKKYQHLERFGAAETQGIEFGRCFVFPKIDGTNASVWLDSEGNLQAGSRRRHLSIEDDNAGFCAWVLERDNIKNYLIANPTHRLYGEWLVPHSLKTYREDAWRDFYVFDVAIDKEPEEILHEGDSTVKYIPYEEYEEGLKAFGINYIPPIKIIKNATYEDFVFQLKNNVFLIEDGKGAGEGIVLKNYDWKSKYGRQTWAKIVTSEFKEKHAKAMGAPESEAKKMVEEEIVSEFLTKAMVEKIKAKIEVENDGWSSKFIPRLLNTAYYDLVKEESWNFIKKHKNPVINYATLKHFTTSKTKELLPELF